MNKNFLQYAPLLFIFILILWGLLEVRPQLLTSLSSTPSPSPTTDPKTQAILKAYDIYKQAKNQKMDLSSGPCLSNNLMPDWVLDIAHNPRQPVDELPENQCSAFKTGQAHHFVELDPDGNLIRAY